MVGERAGAIQRLRPHPSWLVKDLGGKFRDPDDPPATARVDIASVLFVSFLREVVAQEVGSFSGQGCLAQWNF